MENPPRHRKSPTGFTIAEILISTGILSLVLLACYALVAFALKWNVKMTDSVETYQMALRTASRINYDLGTGNQGSFIYDVDETDGFEPNGFAFASARPPAGRYQLDPSNRVLWPLYIVYYIENNVLYRHEIPIDPPVTSLPDTPDLPTLRGMLSTQGAIMAERIYGLEVEAGSGASIVFRVEGKQEEKDGTKSNAITLRSRMNFRQF